MSRSYPGICIFAALTLAAGGASATAKASLNSPAASTTQSDPPVLRWEAPPIVIPGKRSGKLARKGPAPKKRKLRKKPRMPVTLYWEPATIIILGKRVVPRHPALCPKLDHPGKRLHPYCQPGRPPARHLGW